MADDAVDLPGGLLRIIAEAGALAAACRDMRRAQGLPAVGESVLAEYLSDGLVWAAAYVLWRDEEWDSAETPEEVLRSYLQGE